MALKVPEVGLHVIESAEGLNTALAECSHVIGLTVHVRIRGWLLFGCDKTCDQFQLIHLWGSREISSILSRSSSLTQHCLSNNLSIAHR